MKIRTVFVLMLTGLLVIGGIGIIWTANYEMRRQALGQAESKARILLDHNLATHTYFSHQLKPALFERSGDLGDPEDFEPVWMSSTYAVRQMQQYFNSLSPEDYYYKECAINARSPENETDAFERRFLQKLNRNPDLTVRSGVRTIDGQRVFYVLRRGETMEKSCLRCHSEPEKAPDELVAEYGAQRSFHREPGEVVSAISIRIPVEKAMADANRISVFLSGIFLGVLGAILSIILWFNRTFLFAPIERIRVKSRQIAESETHLGETIDLPKGKELRDLTRSFNDMSIKLARQMEELEVRVKARTAELSQKNAELQKTAYLLEQSEQKYRSIMESMPDAVYMSAPDYTVSYMNQAMIRRIGRDATGEPCYRAIHGLKQRCEWCRYEQVAQGKYACHDVESPLDGHIYNIIHAPVFNPDGTVSKLSIYRDITEYRRMEAELFNARKHEALAVMAGGLAHDFNNLMSVILGYISMLKEDADSESTRQSLQNAERACLQARQLTMRLLMLTRSAEPQKQADRIEPVVTLAAESTLHDTPSVTWRLDVQKGLRSAVFDPAQMETVFSEIITNAKEAMPDGGELSIHVENRQNGEPAQTAEKPGPWIRIRFADTGRGIAGQHREKIFDPYFTTREMGAEKGKGLGLSTVYAVVRKHGGRVQVMSRPGRGTEVIVDLPAEAQ